MIVATLIATISFQAGLNPPRGFIHYDDKGKQIDCLGDYLIPGQAQIAENLSVFLLCDMIAFLSSLSIILLMICGSPQWKYMTNVLILTTWVAIFSTGSAFLFAVPLIFPSGKDEAMAYSLFTALYWIMIWFVTCKLTRLTLSMHRKVFWLMLKGASCCFLLCPNQHTSLFI